MSLFTDIARVESCLKTQQGVNSWPDSLYRTARNRGRLRILASRPPRNTNLLCKTCTKHHLMGLTNSRKCTLWHALQNHIGYYVHWCHTQYSMHHSLLHSSSSSAASVPNPAANSLKPLAGTMQ